MTFLSIAVDEVDLFIGISSALASQHYVASVRFVSCKTVSLNLALSRLSDHKPERSCSGKMSNNPSINQKISHDSG